MPVRKTKKLPKSKPATKPPAAKTEKEAPGKNGGPARKLSAPSALPNEAKVQYNTFSRAIQLFHKKNYREAKEMFEKARQGPSREISANAALHIRVCERRLAAPPPAPKSAEDHYNYAIALINLRNLEPARRHLASALQLEPRADHIHYAMAVCLALSGDAPGAYDSLKRAIELQPRNRMAARQDSDFDGVSSEPLFDRLLYPD